MKKLSLSLDALQVEAFETVTVAWREPGTVRARAGGVNAADADARTQSECATCESCERACCVCRNSSE